MLTFVFVLPSLPQPPARRPRKSILSCKRRAPRTFVRLRRSTTGATLLQTAVTTFTTTSATSPPFKLQLHSLLHIADLAYYTALQASLADFTSPTSIVLFELITPASNTSSTTSGLRALSTAVQSPPATRRFARELRAVAQADALDLRTPDWYLADLPSEQVKRPFRGAPRATPANLFLRFATALLPCPELFQVAAALAPPPRSVLAALATLDLVSARRAAYAGLAETSASVRAQAATDPVSARRDAAAVDAVRAARDGGMQQVALLYGAWHAGRLCRIIEDSLEMRFEGVEWRTAMTLPEGRLAWQSVLLGAGLGAAYFSYAGLDWVTTFMGVVGAVEKGSGVDQVAEMEAKALITASSSIAPSCLGLGIMQLRRYDLGFAIFPQPAIRASRQQVKTSFISHALVYRRQRWTYWRRQRTLPLPSSQQIRPSTQMVFTGIVEEMGQVIRIENLSSDEGGVNLNVSAGVTREGVKLGDSISVNGTCLTITDLDAKGFTFGLAPETLRRTNLGKLVMGSNVNLERSLAADGRFGGHVVQGHVDCTGNITAVSSEKDALWFTVSAPSEYMKYIVEKGYIAVDGTSLTVCDVSDKDSTFTFMMIGYTQAHVVTAMKVVGDDVNIEVDITGKYIERIMAARGASTIMKGAKQTV